VENKIENLFSFPRSTVNNLSSSWAVYLTMEMNKDNVRVNGKQPD